MCSDRNQFGKSTSEIASKPERKSKPDLSKRAHNPST
jgi:hypothetical protein